MSKSNDNPILVNVYGTKKVDGGTFNKGMTTVEQINQATDAARADSNAASPRKYSER